MFFNVFSYLTPTMPTSSFGITMDLGKQCLDEVMSKNWQNKLAYYKLTFKQLLTWILLVTLNMRPGIWQHSSTYWHPQACCHMKLDLKSIHFLTQYNFVGDPMQVQIQAPNPALLFPILVHILQASIKISHPSNWYHACFTCYTKHQTTCLLHTTQLGFLAALSWLCLGSSPPLSAGCSRMLVLVVHPTKQQKKEAALQKACRRCPTFFFPKTCTSAKPQIKIFFFGWVLLQIMQDGAPVESWIWCPVNFIGVTSKDGSSIYMHGCYDPEK